jgi:GR25 family glycosyltransferase involved in LPS biosynthesis
MKFYCINIKEATDRRAYCEKQFAGAGIEVQFVQGVNGRKLQLRHPLLASGKMGCYLSFMNLYEEIARAGGDELCVVFEDDIKLDDDFKAKLHDALQLLPADAEFSFIGWWADGQHYPQLKMQPVNEKWMRITSGIVWGNYGQLVNATGAAKMLDVMSEVKDNADEQIFQNVIAGHVKGYFLKEPIVHFTELFVSQTR